MVSGESINGSSVVLTQGWCSGINCPLPCMCLLWPLDGAKPQPYLQFKVASNQHKQTSIDMMV